MVMEHINYLAVLVAAIAYMLIGGFWFSPMAFGKQWMKEMKFTKKDMKNWHKYTPLILIAANFVVFWVLAFLISFLDATTWLTGASVGFICWLGFIAPMGVSGMLWEKKSFELLLIQNSYCVASFMFFGGMLAVWR
jgi:hypothetical protein